MAETGTWVFVIGLLLALFLGIFIGTATYTTLTLLIVLGLIIGFLNITEKEVHGFLIASIALLLAGSIDIRTIPLIGYQLQNALNNVLFFIAPVYLPGFSR